MIGLADGTYLSTHPGSRLDRIISYFAAISFAITAWWLGIILILLFAIQFRIFPSGGMYSSPPPVDSLPRFWDLVLHATLPIITLVLVSLGPYIYVVRTMTINIAQEDFVRTARAKGLRERRVLTAHILRVASPPIVTGLILGLTGTLGGSILIETVFDWQGMGRLYFETFAGTPDEGMIVALTFVFTLMYIVARIILEIMYVLLDPRVRYLRNGQQRNNLSPFPKRFRAFGHFNTLRYGICFNICFSDFPSKLRFPNLERPKSMG